jgi:ribosomal protein L14E/L6E/L27E
MARKIRSDSLYAKLTPDQRDLLFEWLCDEGIGHEEASARCAEQFGLQPSESALSGYLKQHGFAWRMDRAKEMANDKATSLPKDYDAKKKTALAQREFEKAYHDLTTQEVIALQRLDLDRQIAKTNGEIELEKLKISREKLEQKNQDMALERAKFKRTTCELFMKWYGDQKAKEIMAGGGTNAEKIDALGQAMFGEDWTD